MSTDVSEVRAASIIREMRTQDISKKILTFILAAVRT
jgi:hypothetical protein